MKSPLPKKVGHRHDHVDDRPQTYNYLSILIHFSGLQKSIKAFIVNSL